MTDEFSICTCVIQVHDFSVCFTADVALNKTASISSGECVISDKSFQFY